MHSLERRTLGQLCDPSEEESQRQECWSDMRAETRGLSDLDTWSRPNLWRCIRDPEDVQNPRRSTTDCYQAASTRSDNRRGSSSYPFRQNLATMQNRSRGR